MAKKEKVKGRLTISSAKVKEAINKSASGSGKSMLLISEDDQYELREGFNRLDVIPFEVSRGKCTEGIGKGELWWRALPYVHKNIGPDNVWVVCPKRTNGDKCPICEELAKLQDEGDDEAAKALYSSRRILMNVIDVSKKGDPNKVLVLETSYHALGKTLKEELNISEDESVGSFPSLEGGKTLKIRITEETGEYSYLRAQRIDFLDRDEDYSEEILEDTFDLEKILDVKTYEELLEILTGSSGEEEEEEEEDDPPPKKKKKVKKAVEEEEEEEEEEEDWEQPPKKKKKILRKKK